MVALEIERSLFAAKAPSNPIFFIKHPKTLTLICRAESSTSHNNPTKKNPTPGNRKIHRRKYGTSRRSILKKSLNQEQLIFTTPISEDPVVGIIGGGMSGLMWALNLEQRGIQSTVFDTGIHGLGGRLGTRVIDPQPLVFDHAAQFFTVGDSRFAELVNRWLEKGLVQEWEGPIGDHCIVVTPPPCITVQEEEEKLDQGFHYKNLDSDQIYDQELTNEELMGYGEKEGSATTSIIRLGFRSPTQVTRSCLLLLLLFTYYSLSLL